MAARSRKELQSWVARAINGDIPTLGAVEVFTVDGKMAMFITDADGEPRIAAIFTPFEFEELIGQLTAAHARADPG